MHRFLVVDNFEEQPWNGRLTHLGYTVSAFQSTFLICLRNPNFTLSISTSFYPFYTRSDEQLAGMCEGDTLR